MNFFTRKLRTFAVVAAGLAALLLGSCSPAGSKRPLGPPADVATHAPELVGTWELTKCYEYVGKPCSGSCGGEILILRTDGFGAWIFDYDISRFDMSISWKNDGPVLLVEGGGVSGDYVISGNTLRIKRPNDRCNFEFELKTRQTQ
jgi:hypothetical protein